MKTLLATLLFTFVAIGLCGVAFAGCTTDTVNGKPVTVCR
jgi:hypothetical protein